LLAVPRADAIVLLLVLLMTTFGSLIQAVGMGLLLASLLFMKRSSDIGEKGLEVGTLAGFDGEKPWQDEIGFYDEYKDKVYIKHLYGSLFFGFTSHFQSAIKNIPDQVKVLVIRMDRVPYIDQSGLYALEDAVMDLHEKGVKVILTAVQEQPCDMLKSIDLVPDLIPESHLFPTIGEGFDFIKTNFKL
jgi:SulP family sulfate permease